MVLTFSTRINAPVDEVFAWHTRPGAVSRLSPPWMRMRVVQEAASVRDGTARIRPYGLITWQAEHLPQYFDPPHMFADRLSGALATTPLRWQHQHVFEHLDEDSSLATDRLHTNVPFGLVRSMFAYRQRQLRDEIAAYRRAKEFTNQPMTVAVTGSSGFVGKQLCALLRTSGHRVIRMVRRPAAATDERQWDPSEPGRHLLDGVDAVAHLAGAPILGRFGPGHKAAVRDSRVGPTRALAELAARAGVSAFVTASGIGNYPEGFRTDSPASTVHLGGQTRAASGAEKLYGEDAGPGSGFLADVVQAWEDAAEPARQAGVRTVHVRTGIALSPGGGVLGMMAPVFKLGLGGQLGHGRQWMAWIGLDDLLDIYRRALTDSSLAGPVNAAAPEPVRNSEFTRTLGSVLRRPTVLRVPRLAPAALLRPEGADEFALASQRAYPAKLINAGHTFRYGQLGPALAHMLGAAGPQSQ